jgi:anti-sigma factor RsiW
VRLLAPDIECRQAVELMSDYLDHSLSRRRQRRLERHLAACPHCTAYLEQMRITIALTGAMEPEDLDPEVLDSLLDVYRRFRSDPG